jgi:peroxiredoxin
MKRVGMSVALALSLATIVVPHAQVRAADKVPPPMKFKVGDMAPDFKLQYFDGHDLKDVSLSDYRGKKNVVLAFYVFAFTGG